MENTNWDESYRSKCGPITTLMDNLLTKTHWKKKPKFNNVASKDTILRSTQAFSILPYNHGGNEKVEIWKNFNWKKMEKLKCDFYSIILLMCAYGLSVARTRMWHQHQQKPI